MIDSEEGSSCDSGRNSMRANHGGAKQAEQEQQWIELRCQLVTASPSVKSELVSEMPHYTQMQGFWKRINAGLE